MKNIKFIICICLALIAGTGMCSAQNNRYDEFNRSLAKTHCREYMEIADDYYRRGDYRNAEYYYKKSRSENERYNNEFYSRSTYDKKLDNCSYAIRHGETREQADERAGEELADALISLFGGSKKASSSSSTSSSNRNNTSRNNGGYNNNVENSMQEISYRGMNYSTLSKNEGCRILAVRCYDTETVIDMEYTNMSSNRRYVCIDRNTYIKDRSDFNSNRKILLERAENCAYAKNNNYMVDPGESHNFRLHFGAVSRDCHEIDLLEPGDSSWKFYHIQIR